MFLLYGFPLLLFLFSNAYFLDLEKPRIYINGILSSMPIKEVKENTLFRFSCFVEGNPTPKIYLCYSNKSLSNVPFIGGSTNISERIENENWVNYTVGSVQCSNSDNYTCKGSSDTLNTIEEKRIQITVKCKYFFSILFNGLQTA